MHSRERFLGVVIHRELADGLVPCESLWYAWRQRPVPVLQVGTTVLVGSARYMYSLWQQINVLVEGVPVVLQILRLT